MGIYTTQIEQLYVAYFGRPADPSGLAYWNSVVTANNGNLSAVSAAFAASAEYKADYPATLDNNHLVNAVYQNLFGHSADLAGLNFYATLLSNGSLTIDKIVTQIATGAQGTDLVAYNAKVTAATAFTNSLNTTQDVLAYSGAAANIVAKGFLASVTDTPSMTAAITPANLNSVVLNVISASD